MVDAGDSKSPAFTGVRVRVSPWAPHLPFIDFDQWKWEFPSGFDCRFTIYRRNRNNRIVSVRQDTFLISLGSSAVLFGYHPVVFFCVCGLNMRAAKAAAAGHRPASNDRISSFMCPSDDFWRTLSTSGACLSINGLAHWVTSFVDYLKRLRLICPGPKDRGHNAFYCANFQLFYVSKHIAHVVRRFNKKRFTGQF